MTDSEITSSQAFQEKIFIELDQKLRDTPWNNGAAEAHGLLCALACRGTTSDTIRTRAFLFQLQRDEEIDLIEGLFTLASRDLGNEAFTFDLLLPGEQFSQFERGEALSSWCQGFLQGFLYDNEDAINMEDSISETLHDMIEIGHLELDPAQLEDNERSLTELQEFLRVAVQLLYEHLQPIAPSTTHPPSSAIN